MRREQFATLIVVVGALGILAACGAEDRDAEPERAVREDLGLIEKDTLIVGSEIPFPPFEQGDPPGYEGFDIDVINAVADKLDLETRIEDVPLSTILGGKSGELDLSISAVEITPAREQRVDFSLPYFVDSLSLMVRDGSEIASIDGVHGAIVGVEDGTDAEEFAEGSADASEVRAYATAGEASDALLNAEVDAVIASGPAAKEAIDEDEELIVADSFSTREAYGIVVPEANDALRKAVNAALKELAEDETLAELYEEYFGLEIPARITTPLQGPR